jgi:hypothetical protein
MSALSKEGRFVIGTKWFMKTIYMYKEKNIWIPLGHIDMPTGLRECRVPLFVKY